jgi:hypothetical protein
MHAVAHFRLHWPLSQTDAVRLISDGHQSLLFIQELFARIFISLQQYLAGKNVFKAL